ncbi:MAG TPA: hypothetical protein VFS60_03725 [Thermoanaerobaculia bacterium]|nr:hypothetical protein [Thermoanaerobaculia bacterium]
MTDQANLAQTSGADLYVESFIRSSQLVRYALITVAITSVLLFVGHRNSAEHSWFNSRIDLAHDAIDSKVWTFGPNVLQGRVELARQWAAARSLRSQQDIAAHLQALEEARVNRIVLLGVPFFGVTHDVNDLGFLGSIALLVLMAMLKYSMSRQHENLYLALYRVRQIFRQERGVSRQDGRANLIYHSLAMSQQFTQPPSLARWGPLRRLGFSWLLLPLPLIVQTLALYHDWSTRTVGYILNARATTWSLWTQAISLVIVFALTVACFLYCRSNDKRWKKTFFIINPNLVGRKQPSWWEWVQLVAPKEDYCSEYHQPRQRDVGPDEAVGDPRPVG